MLCKERGERARDKGTGHREWFRHSRAENIKQSSVDVVRGRGAEGKIRRSASDASYAGGIFRYGNGIR